MKKLVLVTRILRPRAMNYFFLFNFIFSTIDDSEYDENYQLAILWFKLHSMISAHCSMRVYLTDGLRSVR